MTQLNKSQGDKHLGYKLMNKAAEKGHKGAKVVLAWAKLFGSQMDQNINAAKEVFENLAAAGNGEAHTVNILIFMHTYILFLLYNQVTLSSYFMYTGFRFDVRCWNRCERFTA